MTQWMAYILIIVGIVIRVIAIRTLGQCFTLSLRLPQNIVTHGLYRYVRHPSYVGSLAILVGMSILCPAVAVCWLAVAFFVARAAQEDAMLFMHPDYREYAQKVGAFIPRIWR